MKNLYAALIKFQSQLKPIAKTKENPYFHSKYADLSSLWDAVRDGLSKYELAIVQLFDGSPEGDQYIITKLIHSSGESLESRIKIILSKQDAQSFGSATTYYRRYAFSAILGLTTEEDDDGNAAVSKLIESQQPSYTPKSIASKPSTQSDYPKCSICGAKMYPSKYKEGEYYCPKKKEHKETDSDQLPF